MINRTCPDCGRPLPADAPGGLCPVCLMHLADVPPAAGTEPSALPGTLGLAEGSVADQAATHVGRYKLLKLSMGTHRFGTRERIELFVLITNLPTSARSLSCSSDGRLLAIANAESAIVWDTANWQKVWQLPGAAVAVLLSPDGQTVLTGSAGNGVRSVLLTNAVLAHRLAPWPDR
ncbi:MAG: hypothetical protein HS113_16390 [Verrucomicrobiales bacterium]|nr:hypothetical protein [Verrucomicrobiales bacterium]